MRIPAARPRRPPQALLARGSRGAPRGVIAALSGRALSAWAPGAHKGRPYTSPWCRLVGATLVVARPRTDFRLSLPVLDPIFVRNRTEILEVPAPWAGTDPSGVHCGNIEGRDPRECQPSIAIAGLPRGAVGLRRPIPTRNGPADWSVWPMSTRPRRRQWTSGHDRRPARRAARTTRLTGKVASTSRAEGGEPQRPGGRGLSTPFCLHTGEPTRKRREHASGRHVQSHDVKQPRENAQVSGAAAAKSAGTRIL